MSQQLSVRYGRMVQRVITTLEDDVDGRPATETVRFSLDGSQYEIDLSTAHAGQLRDALAPWVGAARRFRSSRSPAAAPAAARPDREQLKAMREWARKRGYAISPRGRISQEIQLAYHSSTAAPPTQP